MEPVTHVLTGTLLARSGFNRRAAYATAAMAIAAEFPDIDTLWSLRGPVESFTHHRGITHTLLGLPFEAALIVAVFYGVHRFRAGRRAAPATRSLTLAPVRWGTLYLLVLLALCSHLLLDFTNNYGIRPFAPFHPQWYAASIVFIFDPLLFVLLIAALLLPSLMRLVQREVSSGRSSRGFAPKRPAQVALVLIAAYYGVRAWQHAQAIVLANAQSFTLPQVTATSVEREQHPAYFRATRSLASPDPFSIFRWHVVTDFGPAYQLQEIDTRQSLAAPAGEPFLKSNTGDPAILAAIQSPLGRAYLDWSPMPWITVDRPDPNVIPLQSTVVTLRDPRFMGEVPLMNSNGRSPLTAIVELGPQHEVVMQTMDGREER
ncbi:metal-dependent hydrolase [Granulicella cerasi]|uniref:Metal-dependent hydrolase n=1 Tax=Granulicella cerasi TaxID=741063 RepID=A0ABW1ZCD0_9BACT|nr:metal-dependent hydrolase [Granulicella cerasi]